MNSGPRSDQISLVGGPKMLIHPMKKAKPTAYAVAPEGRYRKRVYSVAAHEITNILCGGNMAPRSSDAKNVRTSN